MLCLKKIMVGNDLRPCGQCMNCRINNKRTWTSRILLESYFHFESIFVTLTYNNDHVPLDETGQPTLKPKDLRLWMHRFRKAYSGMNGAIRFFACGEYGDKSERPHYHAILFGAGLDAEPFIAKTWAVDGKPMGFTQVAELNADRAAYVAAYTTKKMTKIGDNRLGQRHPEFARMSMRRGIGYPAVGWLANTMSTKHGMAALALYGDVWNSVRIDGKIWPISNYLRRHIRIALGLSQDSDERSEQLAEHIGDAWADAEHPKPLPENYGPWKDIATDKRLPLRRKHGQTSYIEIDKEQAQRRADKTNRRSRANPKTATI